MTTKETITRLIDQDIYTNASQMVLELTQGSLSQFDEELKERLTPCLSAPDYSEPPVGYSVRRNDNGRWEWREDGADDWAGDEDTHEAATREAWDAAGKDPDYVEALQHWLVSDYLADALEEVGALVARDVLGFNVWGRTECGQGLEEDSDLHKVAELIEARLAEMRNR